MSGEAGDITPLLMTRQDSNGDANFTIVGVGQTRTTSGVGQATFAFNLQSGTDVVTGNMYLGVFSNTAVVEFDRSSTAGVFSESPVSMLDCGFTESYRTDCARIYLAS